MNVESFLEKHMISYVSNYRNFEEAISEKDTEKFISNIFHLGNLAENLIEQCLKRTTLMRYDDSFHGKIRALDNNTDYQDVHSLHFFRLTRNKVIHDTKNPSHYALILLSRNNIPL